MIDRITKNEERLNKLLLNVSSLEKDIDLLKSNKKDLKLLNKYYGSKNWFKDKEAYESGKLSNIKAGVLSEDAVWNLLEKINEIKETINNML